MDSKEVSEEEAEEEGVDIEVCPVVHLLVLVELEVLNDKPMKLVWKLWPVDLINTLVWAENKDHETRIKG